MSVSAEPGGLPPDMLAALAGGDDLLGRVDYLAKQFAE
jgi:hypothetical protein